MKTTITTIILVLSISLRAQTCSIGASPMFQNVNCQLSSIQGVTISSTPANVSYTIYNPSGTSFTSGANTTVYQPLGTGSYTVKLLDINTGCTNTAQFAVASADVYPTYTLSPSSFVLGCAPKDVFILGITTTTSSGAPTYTVLSPGSPTAVPNAPLGIQNNYNINSTGVWTVIVRGNNGCQTRVPITVTENTIAPTFSVSAFISTLTCSQPTTSIAGTSSAQVNYVWAGQTTTVTGGMLTVSTNTAIPSNGLINSYTLNVIDANNGCTSSTILPVYQNITTPTLNIGSTYTLDCWSNSVLIDPINPNLNYNFSWTGGINTPSLSVTAPGGYTLQTTNPTNGCSLMSSVTVYTCQSVGIEEYALDPNAVFSYTDLMGRPMDKAFNVPMIEWVKVGDRILSRKLLIQN